MHLGVIADDLTGASDVANTLARGGLATRLFVGPDAAQPGGDAAVVALKSRSLVADEAVALSLRALQKLQAAGAKQILFKYCSTFDSTSQGNIGPVAQALAEALGTTGVIVCPAFPETGRTVYQGHLFVGDRLLSESGMERHPLNPMTDPDIRRWLAAQTSLRVGHVPHGIVRAGQDPIREALATGDADLLVVDALSNDDLRQIGGAAADAPLVTGGSGIALGLAANVRSTTGSSHSTSFAPNDAPAVILSGSCSTTTAAQVAAYRVNHPAFEIDPLALLDGQDQRGAAIRFMTQQLGKSPLIFSGTVADRVRAVQDTAGAASVAAAIERLFGELAVAAVAQGFGRIVTAGGETSGAVIEALAPAALDIGPEIAPGVPAMSMQHSGRTIALALKSGNFGQTDFFERAVTMLGSPG